MACGVQNIGLYLWAHHVGTKWSTPDITRSIKTYDLLEIEPKKYEIVGLLWIGFPAEIPPCPPKISLEKVLQKRP